MDFLFIANFSGSKKKDGLLFSFFLYFRVFVSSVQSRSIHWLGSFDLIWFCFFPFFRPRALKKNHLFGVGDEYERGKKRAEKKERGRGLGERGRGWKMIEDDESRRYEIWLPQVLISLSLSFSLFYFFSFFFPFLEAGPTWSIMGSNSVVSFGK